MRKLIVILIVMLVTTTTFAQWRSNRYSDDYLIKLLYGRNDPDSYFGFDAADSWGLWLGGVQVIDASSTGLYFPQIDLGHASDTTITREASGVLAVEGQEVFSELADGLTSSQVIAALSDETGTGAAVFGTSPTFTTSIILDGDTSGTMTIKAPAVAGSTSYTFPTDGGAGEYIETDGSGNLSWSAISGTVPDGTSNGDILVWNPEGASEQWDDITRAAYLTREHVKASSADITAYEATHSQITNYGQAAVDVMHYLPTATSGMQSDFVIGTAQAGNYLTIRADTNDKIYLAGVAGNDGQWVQVTPAVGNMITFKSFKTGAAAYDWSATSVAGGWAAVTAYELGIEAGDAYLLENGTDEFLVE